MKRDDHLISVYLRQRPRLAVWLAAWQPGSTVGNWIVGQVSWSVGDVYVYVVGMMSHPSLQTRSSRVSFLVSSLVLNARNDQRQRSTQNCRRIEAEGGLRWVGSVAFLVMKRKG